MTQEEFMIATSDIAVEVNKDGTIKEAMRLELKHQVKIDRKHNVLTTKLIKIIE